MKRIFFLALTSAVAALALFSCAKETAPVEPVVTAVTINESMTLVEGDEKPIDVTFTPSGAKGDLVWRSSDSEKVGVSNGKVIAKAATDEPVEIYALCGSIKSNICTVTVEKMIVPVTGISFDKKSLELDFNGSEVLNVTIEPADATCKTFTLDCTGTAVSASAEGNEVTVVAKALGEALVIVASTDYPEMKDTCVVTVTREKKNAEDGSYIIYDDMVSTNAVMTFCSVLQGASGVGLINGARDWTDPWWKYKENADFLARKTALALPGNLYDNNPTTCYMTNTDIFVPDGSGWTCRYDTYWGKGCEYYGADLYPGWQGNISDGGFPEVNPDEDLLLPALVDSHYVQIELPDMIPAIKLLVANSTDTVVFFREEDAVRVLLSEDGENFQCLAEAYKFDANGEILLDNLTYDADPDFDGKQIKFVRLTHNGTTSMTRDWSGRPETVLSYKVDNSGWHKSTAHQFDGNASPIAFSEIRIWDVADAE